MGRVESLCCVVLCCVVRFSVSAIITRRLGSSGLAFGHRRLHARAKCSWGAASCSLLFSLRDGRYSRSFPRVFVLRRLWFHNRVVPPDVRGFAARHLFGAEWKRIGLELGVEGRVYDSKWEEKGALGFTGNGSRLWASEPGI